MSPTALRITSAIGLGLVLFVGIGFAIGWGEAALVVGALLVIGSTAWFPVWFVRAAGAFWVAVVIVVFTHLEIGAWAAVIGIAVALLAWRYLPPRVHRRIAFTIPMLVFLIFIVSGLMYLAPGSPFDSEKAASLQVQEKQREKFGVADTALGFFGIFMKRLVLEGSLGHSIKVQGRTVGELLLPALPVSLSLGLLALTFAVGIGLVFGIRAGLRPNSMADYSSMGLAMIGISLPNFVIGAILLIVFALKLNWLPVAGWGGFQHLLLPAITLALPYAAYIARLARGGTIEVMQQDFVRTARAKGLSEREIVLKHALKGAILPVVSFLGPAAAGIFTGSFVVEHLFSIPGMGQWFVRGATGRDYSVVLGTALIYFTIITIFNLLVDLAYAWLDPRVREDL